MDSSAVQRRAEAVGCAEPPSAVQQKRKSLGKQLPRPVFQLLAHPLPASFRESGSGWPPTWISCRFRIFASVQDGASAQPACFNNARSCARRSPCRRNKLLPYSPRMLLIRVHRCRSAALPPNSVPLLFLLRHITAHAVRLHSLHHCATVIALVSRLSLRFRRGSLW